MRTGLPFDEGNVRLCEMCDCGIHVFDDPMRISAREIGVGDEAMTTGKHRKPQGPVASGGALAQHLGSSSKLPIVGIKWRLAHASTLVTVRARRHATLSRR